jgi:hypothetical protein
MSTMSSDRLTAPGAPGVRSSRVTHFDDLELPVLSELWRARQEHEAPAWKLVTAELGIDHNAVWPVLWTLQERRFVSGVERSGGYISAMYVEITARGIDALGDGPSGLAAAVAAIRRRVRAESDVTVIEQAEEALDRGMRAVTNLVSLARLAAKIFEILS